MTNSRKIAGIFILISSLTAGHTVAQDASTIIKYLRGINDAYMNASSCRFDIQYHVYRNASSMIPVESSSGSYYKKKQNYAWTTDNQLIIQNKLYFIMADKESKNLLVGTPVAQSLAFMPIPLDSLIQFCSGYRLVEKGEEKEIQLSFEYALDNVSRIDIRFSKNMFLSRLVMYYEDFSDDEEIPLVTTSPRLEMVFTAIEINGSIDDQLFSEKSFFQIKDGEINPAGIYKEYFLIDQRF